MRKLVLFVFTVACLIQISCKDKTEDPPVQKTKTVNLKIDNYVANGDRTFLSLSDPGEEIAVVLGPVSNTFKITHIQFLFGGTGNNSVNRDMLLKVYKDNGAINPGDLIHSKTHTLTSSNTSMQEIDITADNVTVEGGGSVRLGFEVLDAMGFPCFARENGPLNSSKNWYKSSSNQWGESINVGIAGNFVIRAVVQENE